MLFSRTILAWALPLSLLTVSPLVLLLYLQPVPSAWLIYLLYPGVIVSLLITGGHGGTKFQEAVAPVANFLVNGLCYTLLYGILFWALRRVKKEREAPPRKANN